MVVCYVERADQNILELNRLDLLNIVDNLEVKDYSLLY